MALQASNLPMDTRDNERNPRQMMASCLSKLHSDPMFSIALISPLGPHSGSGAVPRTPATPRHSPPLRGRPRDALFCITSTTKCIKCSCKPLRLLEAAELLEADQRKHDGGHSKETSSGLDRTSFGSVPRATPNFPKLRTWPWNLCWAEAFVNMAVDKCQFVINCR